MSFEKIPCENLKENAFDLIGKQWMLICASDGKKVNAMTASWGGLGVMWKKNVSFCVVRPHRYTYEFMEKTDTYTFSFLPEGYEKTYELFGSKSGRDTDKIAASGLETVSDGGAVYFKEARLALVMRKLYYQDIDPTGFVEREIDKNYPAKDYHRMYIGEITGCMRKIAP